MKSKVLILKNPVIFCCLFQSVEPSIAPAREVSPSSPPLPQMAPVPIVAASGQLTSEQRVKLQSELDVVQSNMVVLGEMLNEMQPGNEQPDELELLQELSATCHSMQERIVDLISKLSNDEITADLLRINDDLNNLFLRYSRWEKNREAGGQSASAVLAKAIIPNHKPLQSEDSLIDLGPPDDLTNQLSKLGERYSTILSIKVHIRDVNG